MIWTESLYYSNWIRACWVEMAANVIGSFRLISAVENYSFELFAFSPNIKSLKVAVAEEWDRIIGSIMQDHFLAKLWFYLFISSFTGTDI